MKIKLIETKEKKQFRPFKIELTIESKQEAIALWHRFNTSNGDLDDIARKADRPPIDYNSYYDWQKIDNILKQQGIIV